MKKNKTDWSLWLLFAGFILILAMAARDDYEMEVIGMMDEQTYEAVKSNLPAGCSESDIVDEYMARRAWYDGK